MKSKSKSKPTVPKAWGRSGGNSNALAQQIVQRNRDAALRAGRREMLRVLRHAEEVLLKRLKAFSFGREELTWTHAETIAALIQIRDVLQHLEPHFAAMLAKNANLMKALGAKDTVQLLAFFEQLKPGVLKPLSLEYAAATRLLAYQFESSVKNWTRSALNSIEKRLNTDVLQGKSIGEVRRAIEQEGLVTAESWRLERLVRTEIMNAYNEGHMQEMQEQRKQNFPDLKKKILATFDARTAYDSRGVHGQVRELEEEFIDGKGRTYLRPPARPNDREVVIPWRDSWIA